MKKYKLSFLANEVGLSSFLKSYSELEKGVRESIVIIAIEKSNNIKFPYTISIHATKTYAFYKLGANG